MSQSTPINLLRKNQGISNDNQFGGGNGGVMDMPQYQQQHQQMMPQEQQQFVNPTSQMMAMQPTQQNFSDSQLVEDILKEFGDSPGMETQGTINTQAFQYATDRAQVPAYKYEDPNSGLEGFNGNGGMNNQNTDFMSNMGVTLSPGNLKDKISRNFRYPILVFVICFLISLPEFNRFLFGFFPRLLMESGQVTLGGVLLKAAVGMVAFAIIALFI